MAPKGTGCTATFTMTAGSASAVTLTTGNAPSVLPNGNYVINVNQDESGTWLSLQTPLGNVQQDAFLL